MSRNQDKHNPDDHRRRRDYRDRRGYDLRHTRTGYSRSIQSCTAQERTEELTSVLQDRIPHQAEVVNKLRDTVNKHHSDGLTEAGWKLLKAGCGLISNCQELQAISAAVQSLHRASPSETDWSRIDNISQKFSSAQDLPLTARIYFTDLETSRPASRPGPFMAFEQLLTAPLLSPKLHERVVSLLTGAKDTESWLVKHLSLAAVKSKDEKELTERIDLAEELVKIKHVNRILGWSEGRIHIPAQAISCYRSVLLKANEARQGRGEILSYLAKLNPKAEQSTFDFVEKTTLYHISNGQKASTWLMYICKTEDLTSIEPNRAVRQFCYLLCKHLMDQGVSLYFVNNLTINAIKSRSDGKEDDSFDFAAGKLAKLLARTMRGDVLLPRYNAPEEDRKFLLRLAETLAFPGVARRLQMMELRGEAIGPSTAFAIERQLEIQKVVHDPVLLPDGREREAAVRRLTRVTRNIHYPYPQETKEGLTHPDLLRCYEQTLSIFKHAYRVHRGFDALTIAARTPPDRSPNLLTRAALDLGGDVFILPTKDPNVFPGRGIVIQNIQSRRVFGQSTDLEVWQDPYQWIKSSSIPWAADIFEDLSRTKIALIRGAILLQCNSPEYQIGNTPYSYIYYNEHFSAEGRRGIPISHLAPTDTLWRHIDKWQVPYNPDRQAFSTVGDKDKVLPTGAELKSICAKAGHPVLDLCWGPALSGGLCAAWPPDSSPYYEWERDKRVSQQDYDIWGHVHPSHINDNRYQSTLTTALTKALLPLRKAHEEVYGVADKYQRLFDIWRVAFAIWGKGMTLDNNGEGFTYSDSSEPISVTPQMYRMLNEAYSLHQGLRNSNSARDRYPVLVPADILDYWDTGRFGIKLDTYDLTLSHGSEKVQLPLNSDGFGKEEREIWVNKLIPIFREAIELRFLDRRYNR